MRALFVLAVIALVLASVACGSDNGPSTSPTRGATPSTTSRTPGPPTVSPTPEPTFGGGGRTPAEGTVGQPGGTPTSLATLVDVRFDRHSGYDRAVFEFDGPVSYRVEYVPQAIQCGTGEPAFVGSGALLQVRFTGAQSHDDQGQPSVRQKDIVLDLPTMINAVETCDFEGTVTWVLGLFQESDFKVTPLEDPLRLAIDVRHSAVTPTPVQGVFP